jgi:hypothetical protein
MRTPQRGAPRDRARPATCHHGGRADTGWTAARPGPIDAIGREGHSVSDGVDAPLDDEWIGFAHDVGILVLVVKP